MADGTISTIMDDRLGIIRVTGRGLWSPDLIDAHFAELREQVERIRRHGDDLLVLVDLIAADVQPAATAERIKANTRNLYRVGDRVAVIVGSFLAKMQLRRTLAPDIHEVFVSANAAMTWLMAYSSLHRPPATVR
jgi:hypothetical protein